MVGPACQAPMVSAHLDPFGNVLACAMNRRWPLGNVTEAPLSALWVGERARTLRRTLARGDLSHGCDRCAWQIAEQGPEAAYARTYDWMEPSGDPPPGPVDLELALGNTCNLQCVMCNGSLSSAIRSRREGLAPLRSPYDDAFFADLETLLPGLRRVKFLGGEPFLVTEHHRVWDLLERHNPRLPCHVTTNGTIWNARVESVLERFPVSFAISIDAVDPATFAAIRCGADLATVRANLDRFQGYCADAGTQLTLAFSLMTGNWREMGELLVWAAGRDLDVYVNTVTHPSPHSLHRLPLPRLREVVRHLEGTTPFLLGRLGRNTGVWHSQLAELRARVEELASGRRAPWETPRPQGVAIPAVDRDRRWRDELTDWAGGAPTIVDLDGSDAVVAVSGNPRLGPLDVGAMVGDGFDELTIACLSAFGPAGQVDDAHTPGILDRRARHFDGHEHHEVRSVGLHPGPAGGTRWMVALRLGSD